MALLFVQQNKHTQFVSLNMIDSVCVCGYIHLYIFETQYPPETCRERLHGNGAMVLKFPNPVPIVVGRRRDPSSQEHCSCGGWSTQAVLEHMLVQSCLWSVADNCPGNLVPLVAGPQKLCWKTRVFHREKSRSEKTVLRSLCF